jgi:hypothetical protein
MKVGIAERIDSAIARQRSSKHVPAEKNKHETTEGLLEVVFFMRSVLELYNEDQLDKRCTSVRDLHTAFNLPYVYDYITKLSRQQAEDIQNHENDYVCGIRQGEARHRNIRGFMCDMYT